MKKERHFNIYEILLVLLILVLPFYYDLSIESKTGLSKLIFINVIIGAIFIIWLYEILSSKKNIYIGKIGIVLFISILSFGISSFFSIHPIISLFGAYMRYQGFIVQIIYFALYLFVINLIREKSIYLLINSSIIAGCITSIYGILQAFGKDPIGWYEFGNRVSGCFGNPVFFAAYLSMLGPLSFSMFIFKRRYLYLFAFYLIFIGLLFARTRAGIVAFFGSLIIFLILGGRIFNKKIGYALLGLFSIFFLSNFFPKTAILQRFTSELFSFKKENIQERFSAPSVGGSGGLRLLMWEGGLDIIKDYPLFGIGPETLQFIWPKYAPLRYMVRTGQESGVDRVHNEILDVAITRGIIGLICYIFLIFVLFYLALRFKEKTRIVYLGVFTASLAYLIQNQFSFAELVITSYFFIFIGMMDKMGGTYSISFFTPLRKALFIAISIFFVITLFFSIRFYLADRAYYQKDYKKAIRLNPYERVYYGALAGFYIDMGEKDPIYYKNAIDVLKMANKNIPTESNFYNIRGVAYQREEKAFSIDRTDEVISSYKKALELNPYFIDAMINPGNYLISKGRFKEAIFYFKSALKIQPWQESWIETLKSLHLTIGKRDEAIADFIELSYINPDSYNIHKALAQLYYEKKDIKNFIKACKETIRINPKDILMRRNLLSIYITIKDYDNARKEAKDILLLSSDPETLRLISLIPN